MVVRSTPTSIKTEMVGRASNRQHNEYYPKCRKDAQCSCSMCEASMDATKDLRPPGSSILKQINNNSNHPVHCRISSPLSRGFLSLSPSPGNKENFNMFPNFDSQEGIEAFVAAAMSPPHKVFNQSSADCLTGKPLRRKSFMEWSRRIWVVIVLVFIIEFAAPVLVRAFLKPELDAEKIRSFGEESMSRIKLEDRLDLLQRRISRVVSGKEVRNCTGGSGKWFLTEASLVHSSCNLYSTMSEVVSIWGYPMKTSGMIGRSFTGKSFTLLSGRVIEWPEGGLKYIIRNEGESWVHPRWAASTLQLDRNTWILEYQPGMFSRCLGGFSALSYTLRNVAKGLLIRLKFAIDSAAFVSQVPWPREVIPLPT